MDKDLILVYDKEDGVVGYVINKDGLIFLTAHTEGRYTVGMLRAIIKTLKELGGDVYTVLPKQYLVDFYSKHFDVSLINLDTKLFRVIVRS